MTENEFRMKMKELGWNKSYVDEIIRKRRYSIENDEPHLDFEAYLIKAPRNYPSGKENTTS